MPLIPHTPTSESQLAWLADEEELKEKSMRYRDRLEAGRYLGEKLMAYAGQPAVLVLALPRGGVPVGFAVAEMLYAPLDVFLVRKLGVPGHEELAMGAIASGGVRVLNEDVVNFLQIPPDVIDPLAAQEQQELDRRETRYRTGRPPLDVQGYIVILVDDGLATGATMRAAAMALRHQQPARIIIAVPIAPRVVCQALEAVADEVVCASMPEPFYAVGLWYEDFEQISDAAVCALLARAASRQAALVHAVERDEATETSGAGLG
jgi:predicted phosphoribosyltransferase